MWNDERHMPTLRNHRVVSINAALPDAPTRVGVHVADDDQAFPLTQIPQLGICKPVKADSTGEAVRIEIIQVNNPRDR